MVVNQKIDLKVSQFLNLARLSQVLPHGARGADNATCAPTDLRFLELL
jgi:hypothetical protein